MSVGWAPDDDGVELLEIVGGERVLLRWHPLGGFEVELTHLDGVVSGALAARSSRDGGVVCARSDSGPVIGAGLIEYTGSDRAYGAVAVTRAWRHRGLGTELAHRVAAVAWEGRCRYLTCRCGRDVGEAERTAALFDAVCVSRVRVAFEQVLVLGPRT